MALGIDEIIPAKIIIDTPLPNPLSVICSPSQVTITLPVVSNAPISKYVLMSGVLTSATFDKVLNPAVIPMDWAKSHYH